MLLHRNRICGRLVAAALALFLLGCPAVGWAQSHNGYTDVTDAAGLTHVQRQVPHLDLSGVNKGAHATAGAAVGDFFGNGLLDLYVTRHDDTDILYRNMGDGTFQDVTSQVFGDQMVNAPTNGAMFADLDNDGALDLYVTGNAHNRHYLYMNDGNGQLVEQAVDRGVDGFLGEDVKLNGMSVTAGDYDNDGYLDLYVADWHRDRDGKPANRLYRNLGASNPGHFEDVTQSSGVHTAKNESGFTGRFADMDRDGKMDLLTVNDFNNSQYFVNNGDGTFTEVSSEYGTGTSHSEMGSNVADYNNDGYLDWFVTARQDLGANRLFRNEMHRGIEGLYFSDQTENNKSGTRWGDWGWATSFIDYDNNGVRDLIMVNGWEMDQTKMRFWESVGPHEDPDVAFTFNNIADEIGVNDDGQGRGLIVADFFGNGYQDILVLNHAGQPVLYRNDGGDNSYLRINTVGQVSNSMGIGAFITVVPDMNEDFFLVHDVNLGSNFLAHNETTAHFGLGDHEGTVDYVHILWPSGIEQELFDVELNQLLTVYEGDAMTSLVPEPHSFALLAVGAALLIRRRPNRTLDRDRC